MSPVAGDVSPVAPPPHPWAQDAVAVAEQLGTDPDEGLGGATVADRAVADTDRPSPGLDRSLAASVLAQLRETMILVLLGAAALSVAVGDAGDAAVIVLVVVLNTTVGVAQERRATGAVAALRARAAPRATVVRDGHRREVPAAEVVVGDLLVLGRGDVVAADARLLAAHELQVDESALTGESQPSDRWAAPACAEDTPVADRSTVVHAGTLVVRGRGRAVVTAVGLRTELGTVDVLLQRRRPPPTPLQRRLARLGRAISLGVVVACVLVGVAGLARGEPWPLVVLTALSLAVAAIPESLPAVVALALAGATRRMARLGVIVRTLPAVEALGSVTVLAVDKTGTLTTGRITCTAVWHPDTGTTELTGPLPAGPARAVLEAAVLGGDAEEGTPGTEGAVARAAVGAGLDLRAVRSRRPRTAVRPFDAHRRCTVSCHDGPDGPLEVVVGAPEVVLPGRADAAAVVEAWARAGARVLAVRAGQRETGLLRLDDPVRDDAAAAVGAARTAGVRTMMITGDHPATAAAVAAAVGLDTGERDGLPAVHARADPGTKLALVESLRAAGEIVAMTGDGVNDAPALRVADVGVAMGGRGTEVAKEAADVVLGDDGLGRIVAAVAEGRRVADNVRRFVRYGLAGGLAELLVMVAGPFLALGLPLLPAQILWVNLVTHGLPGVAMGSEAAEADVLSRPPQPPRQGILTRRTVVETAVLGGVVAGCSLVVATTAAATGRPWQTMLFVTLALSQLGLALTTRSDSTPLWRLPVRSNPFLYVAAATSVLATLAVVYLPGAGLLFHTVALGPAELAIAVGAAAVPSVLVEAEELRRSRRRAHPGQDQSRTSGASSPVSSA